MWQCYAPVKLAMSVWVLMEGGEEVVPRHVYDPSGEFKRDKIKPPEEIPSGVWYGDEADNFFDAKRQVGMGTPFYTKWRERSHLFPQSEKEAQ